MLIFAGLDSDKADERGAKLKALQAYFNESSPHAWEMLDSTAMSTDNSDRGQNLVVNSHGNATVFAGMNAQKFYDKLKATGFVEGSFEKLYLMACKVGIQAQDNSIYNNFAKDLFRIFRGNNISTQLYAPRGLLNYKVIRETALGQTYYKVTEMYIDTPEKQYPLNEGLLLVQ